MTWRYSDDYCGWAPLPPRAVYREGVGFFYNGASVSVGFDFGLGVSAFAFVATRNFCDPHPWRYRVAPREVTVIYNRTTVINNFGMDRDHRTFINHGIDPGRITAVTHAEIHPIAIRETATRGARGEQLGRDGRTLFVDRPHFTPTPNAGNRGNPQPPMNRGASPRTAPPSQATHQPTTPTSPSSPRAPVAPPARIEPPARVAPPAPAVPPANDNLNKSSDSRRYPSPKMQQLEQQSPRANPVNPGERMGAPAPVLPQAQPQRREPEAPPVQSRPSYSAPSAPPAASAPPDIQKPSAPPASPSRSQDSGRGRDRNDK